MDLGEDFIGRVATHRADHPAVVMGASGTQVSDAELARRSNQVARFLRSVGLRRGDVVASSMENQVGFLEAAWAAQRSGLYYAAINWHLSPDEVEYILCGLRRARARHLARARPPRRGPRGHGCRASRSCSAATATWPSRRTAGATSRRSTTADLDDPTEGCELLYSSGTTGRPKAVKRPLPEPGGLVAEPRGRAHQLPDDLRDERVVPLPLARAAVPLRAAHELPDDASHRRDGDRHGALRRRGLPRARSSGTASPTASSSRRCSCAC